MCECFDDTNIDILVKDEDEKILYDSLFYDIFDLNEFDFFL